MADNHADQRNDTQKCHETEWTASDRQGNKGADHTIGNSGQNNERLDRVFELKHEGDKDQADGNCHDFG